MKRATLTDDTVNTHGSRVITAGIDTAQFQRNPVLLYMHERGKVIGYIKDLKVEGDTITGEPVFDEATELSKQCKKQWEVGSLRMLSIGIDIIEISEDPALIWAGQTAPTITKSRLFEVSVVDIGANNNAIVMRREGKQITLGRDSENPLPLLNNKPTKPSMDLKTFALQAGLPDNADEATVLAKIGELKAANAEVETLRKEKERLVLAQIAAEVDRAVGENRITGDKKEHFVNIGKQIGVEALRTTFASMAPTARLSKTINHSSGAAPEQKTYSKLSEVPEAELREMRAKNLDEYRRLYKAEYGIDCGII